MPRPAARRAVAPLRTGQRARRFSARSASQLLSRFSTRQRVYLKYCMPVPEGTPNATPAAPKSTPARAWLRAVFGLLVIGAAFLGSGLSTCAYRALAPKLPAASSTTTELRGTSAVVTAIRDLAVLETASYHMERVIDLRDKQAHLFGLFESEDAVLLVAAADVLAGVDLSSMHDGDISFDHAKKTARVLLPPPMVLSSHLDNERTYVHTRSTDALARRAEALETRARREAERTLRDAAVDAGILLRARTNATSTIKTLLHGLGFDEVEVSFRAE